MKTPQGLNDRCPRCGDCRPARLCRAGLYPPRDIGRSPLSLRFGSATLRSVLGSYPPTLAAFDGLSRAWPRAVFARRPRQLGGTHSLGSAPLDGRITVMALDFVRRRAEPPSARGFRSRTHPAAQRTLSTFLFVPPPSWLAVSAACDTRSSRFAVARDIRTDDPEVATTQNRGISAQGAFRRETNCRLKRAVDG
jgi:hypothetical protein